MGECHPLAQVKYFSGCRRTASISNRYFAVVRAVLLVFEHDQYV